MAEENAPQVIEEMPAQEPAQPSNGHSAPLMEKVVRTVTRPLSTTQAQQYADPLMNNINRRPAWRETERSKSDTEFLDDFMIKPESADCILVPHRVLPRCKKDGTPLKQGRLTRTGGEISSFEVMSYNSLADEIKEAWGGGQFRVAICDRSGRAAEHINRVIILQIPSDIYPPKAEEYEEAEVLAKKLEPTGDQPSEELARRRKDIKEQRELEAIEEQEGKLAMARLSRELRETETKQALAKARGGPAPDDGKIDKLIAAMEKRLEDEKRAREAALAKIEEDRKEERRRYEEEKKELQRRLEDEQRRADAARLESQRQLMDVMNRKPDDSMEKIIAALAPIAAAIIARPPPPLPPLPPPPPDHMPALIEMQRNTSQIISAAITRQPDNTNEKVLDAVVKVMNKDNSSRDSMIQGLMAAFMQKDKGGGVSSEMMKELIEFGATVGSANAVSHEHDSNADYDPGIGFLGNTGKALFGALKSLIDSAATNPQVLDLIKAVVGKRNPSNAELAQAAWQMEQRQSGALPPGVGQPLLPVQTYGQPQAYPPMTPPAQRPQPVPAQTQQQQIAKELEGEASGLPSNEGPEEAEAELTPEQMAESHLRQTVTETIGEVVTEIEAQPLERAWPEYGLEHINRAFLKLLVDQPSDTIRCNMLNTKCDPAVWAKLVAKLTNNKVEQAKFVGDLHRMIDQAKEMLLRQPAPQPMQPAPAQSAPTPEPPPQAQQ